MLKVTFHHIQNGIARSVEVVSGTLILAKLYCSDVDESAKAYCGTHLTPLLLLWKSSAGRRDVQSNKLCSDNVTFGSSTQLLEDPNSSPCTAAQVNASQVPASSPVISTSPTTTPTPTPASNYNNVTPRISSLHLYFPDLGWKIQAVSIKDHALRQGLALSSDPGPS